MKADRLDPHLQVRAVPPAASDDLRERLRVYKRVKLGREALSEDVDDFEEYLRTDLTPHSATFDPIKYCCTAAKRRLSLLGSL